MSLLHMFGKEQFYELFDSRIFASANEVNYEEAKQSVRDFLEMSVRHDNVRLEVSPRRALLRAEAFDGMRRQAAKMIKYTAKKHQTIASAVQQSAATGKVNWDFV